jgi:hypothetical protein
MPTLSEDRQSAAIPSGCALVDHSSGHDGSYAYTVTDASGTTIADGIGDVFDAVRVALQHAADEPVATSEPAHTASLPACCTVAGLSALLRQAPTSGSSADDGRVLVANVADVVASRIDRLAGIDPNVRRRCEVSDAGVSVAAQIADEGDSTARYPFAFGVLESAVWALLTTWDVYADVPTSHRLKQLGHDVDHLADVLAGCREGLKR